MRSIKLDYTYSQVCFQLFTSTVKMMKFGISLLQHIEVVGIF